MAGLIAKIINRGVETVGFFDNLFSGEMQKNKAMVLERIKTISDFTPQKEWWSVSDNPFMGVILDNSNNKIALVGDFDDKGGKKEALRLADIIKKEKPSMSQSKVMQEAIARFFEAPHFIRIYDYKDVLRSEVVIDDNSITYTNRTNQAASAAIGYALAGGVGAIIGGLSGKKENVNSVCNVSLRIVVKDSENPLFQIAFLNRETEKKSNDYKKAADLANELHAFTSIFIDQANKIEESDVKQELLPTLSIADELKKFACLLEQGMLSKDEYDSIKAKLLAKA